MNTGTKIFLGLIAGGGIGTTVYYFYMRSKKMVVVKQAEAGFDFEQAADFIIKHEGFVSTPFWDNKQWTWGYGTAAGYNHNSKPTGTITKEQAKSDLMAYIQKDYVTLSMALKNPIKDSQMIALLDFSYNLGIGNGKDIVALINSGATPDAVTAEMSKYNHAGGEVSSNLTSRRYDESQLYLA